MRKSVSTEKKEKNKKETQTIDYVGETYDIPPKDKIATASQESMEDPAVSDVKPAAAITVGGEIPDYFEIDLEGVELSTRTKLWRTSEWTARGNYMDNRISGKVTQQLEKVAPTSPYSHFFSDWDENLRLMPTYR